MNKKFASVKNKYLKINVNLSLLVLVFIIVGTFSVLYSKKIYMQGEVVKVEPYSQYIKTFVRFRGSKVHIQTNKDVQIVILNEKYNVKVGDHIKVVKDNNGCKLM